MGKQKDKRLKKHMATPGKPGTLLSPLLFVVLTRDMRAQPSHHY